MHRLLEKLDRHFTVLVPVTYLAGLFLGTAAYFSGLVLNATLAVGIALAFAAEVHAFLEQRRVRSLWQALSRTTASDDEDAAHRRDALAGQMRLHVGILIGLVLFSVGNGIAFWATELHPTSQWMWAQVVMRGAVVPLLFLATGALAPLGSDASTMLAQAADDMLNQTLKAQTRQWRGRIRKAKRAGADLTPLTIALMLDAGDTEGARRIQIIADGLAAAEGLLPGQHRRPPTGGGTPILAQPELPVETGADLLDWPTMTQTSAPAAFGAPAQASRPMSPEELRVRRMFREHPELLNAGLDEISARANVAKSTASKVRRLIETEAGVTSSGQFAQ